MSNAKKANLLYVTSLIYSAVTTVMIITSLIAKDPMYLKISGVAFVFMIICLAVSYIHDSATKDLPIIIVALGFISMLPIVMFIYIITTIVNLFGKLFKTEGGENDD